MCVGINTKQQMNTEHESKQQTLVILHLQVEQFCVFLPESSGPLHVSLDTRGTGCYNHQNQVDMHERHIQNVAHKLPKGLKNEKWQIFI